MGRHFWPLCAWLVVAAVAAAFALRGLPLDGFYSGDSGVKLIAARNAIEHPARPFQIDLPRINEVPSPYVDRFFAPHDDHSHALQSPIFPVMSSLFIRLFGLGGAYVLPIAGFLATLPLLSVLRRRMAPDVPLWVLSVVTLFASPVAFYGFEFWEHTPAIAALAASTAWLLASNRWSVIACGGAAGAIAVLLRPEAFWYVVPLALIAVHSRKFTAFAAGAASILVPFAVFNLAHSGDAAGAHVTANLAPLGERWLATRWEYIALWLVPMSPPFQAGCAIAAVAWAARGRDLRVRQAIALGGAACIAIAAVAGAFTREALWTAAPIASLLFVPAVGTLLTRRMWLIAAVSLLGILLTSAHDGGAQWGPRFLLIGAPAILLLASYAAASALQPGYLRVLRVGLVIVILACGVWTTRAAYRELRGAKQFYAELVREVESATQPGDYVVTNVWWFRQVVATLDPTRTILVAADERQTVEILTRLERAGIQQAVVVWTGEADGVPLDAAIRRTCFRVGDVRRITQRDLNVASVRCPASAAFPSRAEGKRGRDRAAG
jgi:hypothetical protein